jgi:hypothetical protein
MSAGNFIGIGGAIIVFGLTLLVLLKEFVTPWLVRHIRFRRPSSPVVSVLPKLKGVRITMKGSRRGNGPWR